MVSGTMLGSWEQCRQVVRWVLARSRRSRPRLGGVQKLKLCTIYTALINKSSTIIVVPGFRVVSIWSKSDQFQPSLIVVGPNVADIGPCLAEFGAHWPMPGQAWRFRANVGRQWPVSSQSWSNNLVAFGPIPSHCWSILGEVWSNLVERGTSINRTRPQFGRLRPETKVAEFGQRCLKFWHILARHWPNSTSARTRPKLVKDGEGRPISSELCPDSTKFGGAVCHVCASFLL